MKTQISALISKAALLLMIIVASILMPFNIYADTITNSNVLGINTILLSKSQNVAVTNSWYYVYQHTITLDADYIGTITLDVNLSYNNPSGSSSSYGTSTISNKTYFVNGNTIVINQTVTSDNYANQGPFVSSSYLLKSSNVVKTSTITELQQIIDLLDDIYNSNDQVEGLLNNQLQQLELCVQNTSLANTYLETISKLRDYDIFPESYLYVIYMMRSYETLEYGVNNQNIINYPVFQVYSGNPVGRVYLNPSDTKYLVIMWVNKNIYNQSTLESNFSVDGDANLEWDSYVYTGYNLVTGSQTKIIKFYINRNTTTATVNLIANSNCQIIPFYLNNANRNNFTTDFALYFNLSNSLLNYLNTIANGTTQSNQQSSDLSSGTDSMQDQMDDLVGIEDSYNQQFNNSVNLIDFSNPLQQNQGLLGASNFVITVFNGLIANNPFSILIIIVCILLIGKKVIGK